MEIGGKNMNWIDEIRKDITSIQSSQKDLKKFGLLIGCVLILVSGFAFWRQWWEIYFVFIVVICGVLLVFFSILLPLRLKIIHRCWMGVAIVIGSIISRIILFFLFYLVLTPLAITAKVFDKRFFFQYREKKQSSFWIGRDNKKTINYERMS
jgi:hypothetical protein